MDEKTIIVKQGSFGSFLRGVLIGAGIALLLAPKSGRETRTMLTERGTEIKDKAVNLASDTRDRAQTVISDARNKIQDTVKSAQQGIANTTDPSKQELEREVTILEDINNPNYNL